MRNYILSFIFISVFANAQKLEIKNNDLSFLLGLMTDYGGRTYIPNHPRLSRQITYFYVNDSLAYKAFVNTIKNSKLEEDFTFFKKKGFRYIQSKKYISSFNLLFKFKNIRDFYFEDEDDEQEYFSGKIGKLRCKFFKTKDQKLSFLKGAYISDGNNESSDSLSFKFGDSLYKSKLVRKFLKQTNCEILSIEEKRSIPFIEIIYFKPSDEFKKLLSDS